MPINPALTDLLACPNDEHGTLTEQTREGRDVLVCGSCGTVFRVEGDMPVLLLDEAVEGPSTP